MFDDMITEDDHQQDVAECALVGSAGISGHKTAWRHISAYAPQDNNPYKPLGALASVGGAAEESGVMEENAFEGLGSLNAIDQGSLFLQAEDFGRAVNDWMNFDMTEIS